MTDDSIRILLSANQGFAQLMLVTVRSLLLNAAEPSRIHLFLIDRGIPGHLKELLEVYVMAAGAHLETLENASDCFREHPAIPDIFFDLPDTGHYDRLLAPYLFPESKILYLDSDLYIQSDITSLWKTSCAGYPVAAVRDQIIPEIGADHGVIDWEVRKLNPEIPYFNSGVMLMNLDIWREREIAEACFNCACEFMAHFEGPPPLHDQYALNVICYHDWLPLDGTWNSFAQKIRKCPEDAKIVHFAGAQKPFHASTTFSGSSRYFIRLAQKLIQPDLDVARKSAECYSRINSHHKQLQSFQAKLLSPNGRNVTFAPADRLAEQPDPGEVAMIIPVRVDDTTSLRFKNLRFLLEQYAKELPHLILSEQAGPDSNQVLSRLVEKLQASSLHHLKFEVDDTAIHKARLINEAARYAFDALGVRYVWQIDADIYANPVAVLNQLAALNSKAVPVVRPLLFFVRLEAAESETVLSLSGEKLAAYEPGETPVSPYQIIDLFGPGTLIFSREAFEQTGGLDESFSGWGWEDMDFAERLKELHTPHTLPLVGVHLHHEEDRIPNKENFTRYRNAHFGDTDPEEIERILGHTVFHNYLSKFCVILFGESSLIPEIERLCSSDERVVFRPSPIDPNTFPTRRELARSLTDQVIYSLRANEARWAGFAWNLTSPFPLPASYAAFREEALINLLVASNFRIVLIEPGQDKETAAHLHYRRLLNLLTNVCEAYARNFDMLVKQLPEAEVTMDLSSSARNCLSHFGIAPKEDTPAEKFTAPTELSVR
ncbi:MAG: hypothetical protein CMO55_17225 [Verrucomicrobiales bacterium]|nr:hypothetical protein [Verrucomicrobiales bacterium]